MAERTNATVLKTVEAGNRLRGFESHSLRHGCTPYPVACTHGCRVGRWLVVSGGSQTFTTARSHPQGGLEEHQRGCGEFLVEALITVSGTFERGERRLGTHALE